VPSLLSLLGRSKLTVVTGNLGQLFNAKGIPFHKSLPDLYGGIVKVYGFFGVSIGLMIVVIHRVNQHSVRQDEQLYITDPRTLHSILIKDSEAFDETSVFTEWVLFD
jgi:hypothetical protein